MSTVGDQRRDRGVSRYRGDWAPNAALARRAFSSDIGAPRRKPWLIVQPNQVALFLLFTSALFVFKFFEPTFATPNLLALTDKELESLVENRSGTNLFNKVKWLGLFAIAAAVVAFEPRRFMRLARFAWPLFLICAIAIASVMWSVDSGATMRRAVRATLPIIVLVVGVAYLNNPRQAFAVLHVALAAMLAQNLAALGIPGTFDAFGNFTGSVPSKNQLGYLAALAILVGLCSHHWTTSAWQRAANLAYLAGWALVLALSVSKTSIALTLVVPVGLIAADAMSRYLGVGIGFLTAVALSLVLVVIGFVRYGFGLTPLQALDLEHVTFTGRTQIWDFMIDQIDDRLLFGYGFGAFWGIGGGAPSLTATYEYIWYLDSAHNGYIDLTAHIGLLGLLAFAVILVHFSRAAAKLFEYEPSLYRTVWLFVLFVLLHNLLESTIFRPIETPLWLLFTVSVLVTLRIVSDARREQAAATPPAARVSARGAARIGASS